MADEEETEHQAQESGKPKQQLNSKWRDRILSKAQRVKQAAKDAKDAKEAKESKEDNNKRATNNNELDDFLHGSSSSPPINASVDVLRWPALVAAAAAAENARSSDSQNPAFPTSKAGF